MPEGFLACVGEDRLRIFVQHRKPRREIGGVIGCGSVKMPNPAAQRKNTQHVSAGEAQKKPRPAIAGRGVAARYASPPLTGPGDAISNMEAADAIYRAADTK